MVNFVLEISAPFTNCQNTLTIPPFRNSREIMSEEKASNGTHEDSLSPATSPDFSKMSMEDHAEYIRQLKSELEGGDFGEPEFEEVPLSDEQMEALSNEEIDAQINLLQERIDHRERGNELDRKAVNLGLLRLANQARRCSHLKSNGKPCRAPAMGNNLFCVFHGRALDTNDGQALKVTVLEDRESLQLALKQIMEHIVSGRIEPQNASLLLRAVQIAGSTVKRPRGRAKKPRPVRSEPSIPWDNAEENLG